MIRSMFLALMFSYAGVAAAQSLDPSQDSQPPQSFEDVRARVALGETLYVMDTEGWETKGQLANVLDSMLTLRLDGNRLAFTVDRVERIEREYRDPVRNGVLIGLVSGAFAGYALGRYADSPTCPRPGVECGQGAVAGAVGGAFWGAVGGWITDLLIRGRETLFVR